MIPLTDMDYVILFANKLKVDNSLFKQQKILIESQLAGSKSLFRNMFGEDEAEFKKNARAHLRKQKLL